MIVALVLISSSDSASKLLTGLLDYFRLRQCASR
jgi:hypothetical protein